MVGKTLILGISGGIAAYKMPELISRLRKKGITVEVILTKAATEFVTPLTLREISQHPVHLEMFNNDVQWNVEHIALAKKADLLAVIPATANIIGKVANGIADDLLTSTIMASKAPILFAPAMNSEMYDNPIFQRNLTTLIDYGYHIVGPESGYLLCGDTGMGRLVGLDELEINILKHLSNQDLTGETILVTAGGTREPIDPVRFIGNRSSGKMGHALAEAAFKRGAAVQLISTAETAPHYTGISTFHVETTQQMHDLALELAPRASIVIKAAAPADFRPESYHDRKIKKSLAGLNINLVLNPDILMELGHRKTNRQILVGFAAETESLQENARVKLEHKNLDLIIGNLINIPGIGMGSDLNRVTIYSHQETVEIPEMPKDNLAEKIFDYILKYKNNISQNNDC